MATMVDPDLLSILCCPETHQPLSEASTELITQYNQRIAEGQMKNRAGENISDAIEGGLVREDGQFLYPIRNNIPVLLVDEALTLTS